jgi:DNA-directed RNA polymerase subunit M/transcription elongation factor TFIIS
MEIENFKLDISWFLNCDMTYSESYFFRPSNSIFVTVNFLLSLCTYLEPNNSQTHYLNPAWFEFGEAAGNWPAEGIVCWLWLCETVVIGLPVAFLFLLFSGVQDFMRRLGLDLLITPLDDTVGSKQGNQIQQRAVVNDECPKCKHPNLEYYTRQVQLCTSTLCSGSWQKGQGLIIYSCGLSWTWLISFSLDSGEFDHSCH